MRITALAVLLAAGCALSLGACVCSVSKTAQYFGRTDLERTVEYLIQQEGEMEIMAVDCPSPLQIEAYALTRCILQRADGTVAGATVVVTEASGDRGRIDVTVDAEQPS